MTGFLHPAETCEDLVLPDDARSDDELRPRVMEETGNASVGCGHRRDQRQRLPTELCRQPSRQMARSSLPSLGDATVPAQSSKAPRSEAVSGAVARASRAISASR